MKLMNFKGGVHPNDKKSLSKDAPVKTIDAEKMMVYPLAQHIGAPAVACVKAGDRVLKGTLLATKASFVSAAVHSSVSGKVKRLENRRMITGKNALCIIVENDFEDEAVDGFGEERDVDRLSKDEIINIISSSGIVGLGGAGFPTDVKLSPSNAEIKTIIINACECEPYLTSDYKIMSEKSGNIIEGILIILRLFHNARAVIAVEDNKKDVISAFKNATENYENISVAELKTKYPQGGERQLIYAVTGKKINSKMLPADVNTIVCNAATVYSVFEAVKLGIPLIRRTVTVTGDGVNEPCNANVPLGISYSYFAEQCGGIKNSTVKIISGGPMMGTAMDSLDYPIIKTSSSLLALCGDDVEKMKTSACIKCGRCVEACPENLVPQLMANAAINNRLDEFEKLYGMECIECGCCAYVCPAKRPLTQSFKAAKMKIRLQAHTAKEGK